MIKISEVEQLLDVFGSEKFVLSGDWAPSVNDLENLDVKKNFDKYAKFLLYLQECFTQYAGNSSAFSNLTPQELKETKSYINKLLANNINKLLANNIDYEE